jgi:hypothetical protein
MAMWIVRSRDGNVWKLAAAEVSTYGSDPVQLNAHERPPYGISFPPSFLRTHKGMGMRSRECVTEEDTISEEEGRNSGSCELFPRQGRYWMSVGLSPHLWLHIAVPPQSL